MTDSHASTGHDTDRHPSGSSLSRPPTPLRTISAKSTVHVSAVSVEARSLDSPSHRSSNVDPSAPFRTRTSYGLLRSSTPTPSILGETSSRPSRAPPMSTDSSAQNSIYEGITGGPTTLTASTSPVRRGSLPDGEQDGGSSLMESTTSRSALPSIKGKEKAPALDEADLEGVLQVEGEVVKGTGDAERDLRDLAHYTSQVEKKDSLRERQPMSISGPSRKPSSRFSPRRYYVLTDAGKPVFTSHEGAADGSLTNMMGVVQALISIFADEDDRPRCIIKGRYRIAFVLKSPLYLFCVSDWGEPEHVLRMQLDYINLQILSVVSGTQLSRVFQRRSNFDLSRLLEGTEGFLHSLIDRCQDDFSFLTSTLQPLRMPPALRETAAAALMPPEKLRDLLYVLLVAAQNIVTVLRPRKHSIHPSDLHLLLNTLSSSKTLRTSETWLPICLPKFNQSGFVHAYVSYILEDVGLIFVSADKEAFEKLRIWKNHVAEHLQKTSTLQKIQQAAAAHSYTVSALGCPGLRHFLYKSRQHVQITCPEWDHPYVRGSEDQKRIVTLFQQLHDDVHARSGQASPLKLLCVRNEHEICLAWVTKPFELYLALSPRMSKSAIVATANNVAKWISGEDSKLFLKDAPVF